MSIKQTDLAGELFNIRYYLDDDAGIKAYLVPRSEVEKAKHIKDLQEYFCVYFLLGRNDETFNNGIYVGITHDQTAWYRLFQHNNSTTDKYRDYWNKALIIVRPGIWKDDRVRYLEEVFWIEADREKYEIWNTVEPSKSRGEQYRQNKEYRIIDIDSIARLVRNIDCEAYNSFLNERYNIARAKIKNDKSINSSNKKSLLKEIDSKYYWVPEIEVPNSESNNKAKEMVDMIFRAIDKRTADMDTVKRLEYIKKLRFLDIACKKNCELLNAVAERLDSELKEIMPSKTARNKHIANKQLFGLSIRYSTYLDAQQAMPGTTGGKSNIRFIPKYMSLIKDLEKYQTADGKISEHSKLYREILGIDIIDKVDGIFTDIFEDGEAMKFDVVIGNPPYNDDTDRGNGGGGNSLYLEFAKLADELSSEFSSLIMPSNWMIQYPLGIAHATVDEARKDTNKMIELHDFPDAKQVFDSVSIPGGVCFYVMGKNPVDYSKYYLHDSKETPEPIATTLYNDEFNVVFRDKYIIDIVNKIRAKDGIKYKRFNDCCVGAKHHFDDGKKDGVMVSNWKEYSLIEYGEFNIEYFVNPKTHKGPFGDPLQFGYVSKDQIPKNIDDYRKHKLLVGQAHTAGSPQILDVPMYVGNNSVCSQSYIPIFSLSNTKEECLIIAKYIKTKFFRYLVSVLKSDQNIGNRTYALVPMQNFTTNSDIDWTKSISEIDEQLYKKYSLSKSEIDYIKDTIKPMD